MHLKFVGEDFALQTLKGELGNGGLGDGRGDDTALDL